MSRARPISASPSRRPRAKYRFRSSPGALSGICVRSFPSGRIGNRPGAAHRAGRQPSGSRRGGRGHLRAREDLLPDILEFFFQMHRPDLGEERVGPDYRSEIFYTSDEQRQAAEDMIADASGMWPGKVVTKISEAGPFWEAKAEDQDYFSTNPTARISSNRRARPGLLRLLLAMPVRAYRGRGLLP